ncbi:MAG: hypothetical protein ABL864_08000 [Terricaulis sp.]
MRGGLKLTLQAVPYVVTAAYWIIFWKSTLSTPSLVEIAAREPNEATGETWHVLLRGQSHIYLTPYNWALFNAPFLAAPFAAIAGFFIWRDLWRSGFYDRQR